MAALSIIVPVLDEAEGVVAMLTELAPMRARGVEVIVVDGGSVDGTLALARPHADAAGTARRGRAAQMNAGAALARGNVLLFLHADTILPRYADALIADGMARHRRAWGRFDVRIDSPRPTLALVTFFMNLRSRLTGIATGDQAMFMTRAAFEAAGGFPEIALMEDIALSKRLKRLGPPLCLRECVTTSARRWENHGIWRTVALMWWLRLAYFLGVKPDWLARRYGYTLAAE
jgi:rSAM/selenodomain-associated transferase 2